MFARYAAALMTLLALLALAGNAAAAPQAHLLRVDPRASVDDNQPVLTTVVALVQHKPMSDVTSQCAHLTGNANLACISSLLEQPKALYDAFKFPEKNALFTVTVDGRDVPATFASAVKWKNAKKESGVGTAWLILLDASSGFRPRFEEAKTVAKAFIQRMGPNDIVDILAFNDRSVVKRSKWLKDKGLATNFVDGVVVFAAQGRTKQLFQIVKQGVTDSFGDLGNVGGQLTVPLHQATVLLSDGDSGSDTSGFGPGALALKEYLTKGRFPEDNTTLPRTPLPMVSVWFPTKATEEFFQNARGFMENLANPEIGGGFFVVQGGEAGKGDRIAQSVHTRFDDMYLVKWRVACVAPQISQDFKLVFKNTNPPITGDNCLQCPLGIDPTQWPLDVDLAATQAHAQKNPVHPGGTVKVFGNFCWGTEYERAELYMIPKDQPPPTSLKGKSIEEAKQAQQTLIRSNMKGKSVGGGDTYVEFEVPDSDKFLVGKGKSMTARLVVYDSFAKRTSPVVEGKLVTVRAEDKPLNLLLIGGITFGGVVLLLLIVTVVRGGGKRERRSAAALPAPVVAGARPPPGPVPGSGGGGPPAPGPAPSGGFGGAPAFPSPGPAPANPTRAVLSGTHGSYTVAAGRELKVGRDPGLCDIHLTEPRISGMHASLKFEGGRLMVRDEGSNNGTYVSGGQVQSYGWVVVPPGSAVRFGPIEFTVQLE